jgi:hypothetical protein
MPVGRARVYSPAMANRSTITLLPAGASNYRIAHDRSDGALADQLDADSSWERQALVEEAQRRGWRFSHQHQLDDEGGAIQLSFDQN